MQPTLSAQPSTQPSNDPTSTSLLRTSNSLANSDKKSFFSPLMLSLIGTLACLVGILGLYLVRESQSSVVGDSVDSLDDMEDDDDDTFDIQAHRSSSSSSSRVREPPRQSNRPNNDLNDSRRRRRRDDRYDDRNRDDHRRRESSNRDRRKVNVYGYEQDDNSSSSSDSSNWDNGANIAGSGFMSRFGCGGLSTNGEESVSAASGTSAGADSEVTGDESLW